MKVTNEIKQQILAALQANGSQISAIGLFKLIEVTNAIVTPTFAVLHDYTSDKSDNTELADYTLNLGVKYENAKDKSVKLISQLTSQDVAIMATRCTPDQIKGFEYINLKGVTPQAYCEAVKLALPQAIEEMKTVKDTPNDAVIHVNSILSYNANTGNLLLAGELVKGGKTVSIQGEVKTTAKGAKTVAKEVVKNYLNTRTSKIRSFAITNLHTVSVNGEKITLIEM